MKNTQAIIKENDGANEICAVNFPFNNAIAEIATGAGEIFYAIGKTRISEIFNDSNKAEHDLFRKEATAITKTMAMVIIGYATEIAEDIIKNEKRNDNN